MYGQRLYHHAKIFVTADGELVIHKMQSTEKHIQSASEPVHNAYKVQYEKGAKGYLFNFDSDLALEHQINHLCDNCDNLPCYHLDEYYHAVVNINPITLDVHVNVICTDEPFDVPTAQMMGCSHINFSTYEDLSSAVRATYEVGQIVESINNQGLNIYES